MRRKAAMRLGAFTALVSPWWVAANHHRAICQELEALERGETRRLMIFIPPRHGKSELFSVHFPAWWLGRHPNGRVVHASYGADLSNTFSRRVRNMVRDDVRYRLVFPGVSVARDSQSVTQWEMAPPHRGGFRSVGVGTGVTGHGADLGIIDDPVKGAEAADSETQRDAVWQWYLSDFYTRLHPDARIVLGLTRWHEDDLAGRILASEDGPNWRVLSLPALSDAGQALWPQRYNADTLDAIRRAVGSRTWSALYQQRPAPEDGNVFKRPWFPVVDALPSHARRIRYWDKASTRGGGDYSAGALLAESDGLWYIAGMVRGQWSSHDRNAVIRQTAALDGWDTPVWVEQEPGSGGKESAEITIRELAGYDVHAERVTGDKVSRARPLAAQAEAGNVRIVRGDWNTAFLDEICAFPNAAHDDQVDAVSGAFNHLALSMHAVEDITDLL